MAWYNGTTEEAIAESKVSSKLFVVYIEGKDDTSKKMTAIWETPDILTICKSKCICLKLENNSVACQQFSQFYPVLIMPCTYMIGINGVPIDILGGYINENKLVEKLTAAIQSSESGIDPQSSGVPAPATPANTLSSQTVQSQQVSDQSFSAQSNQTGVTRPTLLPEDVPHSSAFTGYSDDDITESHSAPQVQRSSLTPTEKVKKWQEKLKDFRQTKEAELQKDKKMKEIARRTTGKQLQEMKQQQEEIKRKNELEQRKKDKKEQAEALNNVREQIARDRAEKQKRFEAETQARKESLQQEAAEKAVKLQQEQQKAVEERNKFARLQFRFPNGSSLTRRYQATDVFSSCLVDLERENSCGLPPEFELFTTMPNRVFQDDDKNKTLAQLNLIPSAIVYVRPKKVLMESKLSLFGKIFSFLLLILSFPLTLLSKFSSFFGFTSAPHVDRPASQVSSFTDSSESGRQGALRQRRKPGRDNRATMSDGNVTRLRNRFDDDEDSATWNGNSTQQM